MTKNILPKLCQYYARIASHRRENNPQRRIGIITISALPFACHLVTQQSVGIARMPTSGHKPSHTNWYLDTTMALEYRSLQSSLLDQDSLQSSSDKPTRTALSVYKTTAHSLLKSSPVLGFFAAVRYHASPRRLTTPRCSSDHQHRNSYLS